MEPASQETSACAESASRHRFLRDGSCNEALSSSQQRALFRELHRPGTSACERALVRSRLVVGTLPIVLQCVGVVAGSQARAELVQEGVLALIHAVDAFAGRDRKDFTRFAIARVARWLREIKRGWAEERALLVDSWEGDNEAVDPFSLASQLELTERLDGMIHHLPDDQQLVLRLRFGIGGGEAQSREAVGEALCFGQQRVRFLEECALLALRRSVERERASEGRLLRRRRGERRQGGQL